MGPGDLIRTHRRRRGLSQMELAGRGGISTMKSLRVEYFFPEDEATRLELQRIAAPEPAGTPQSAGDARPG